MDRRGFLKFFGAGVAGIALEQAIPLGRVWSFPKEIKRFVGVDPAFGLDTTAIMVQYLEPASFQLSERNRCSHARVSSDHLVQARRFAQNVASYL